MFFFPIRSDRRLNTTPWVNLSLIAINALVFLFTRTHVAFNGNILSQFALNHEVVNDFILDPTAPKIYQLVTYQFLHANLMHLLGNMLFLYVFGNSVEDRLGKIGYLFFYLAGGVVAGFGHSLLEGAPVLGASGAVAAVTGAYLALFPLSNITIAYWFFYIGTFEVSGRLLILFQVAENVVLQARGEGSVAYLAHLFGYTYGFLVGMGLLWSRLLPREPFDMLAMWEQFQRRSRFRALTRTGYQPWQAVKAGEPPRVAAGDLTPAEREITQRRARILAELSNHNHAAAAEAYEELLGLDPAQVLGQQQQLDVANQLMSQGRHQVAAKAYELFLNTYKGVAHREQVELMLGLLYARYLDRRQRARELLAAALPRLHDEQQTLARQVLEEIG